MTRKPTTRPGSDTSASISPETGIENSDCPLERSVLRPSTVEQEVIRELDYDLDSRRRVYLRPAGDGTARFQANLPGGGLMTAEANIDDQIMLKIASSGRSEWVPIMIFQSAASTTHGIRLTSRHRAQDAGQRSYSMAADDGDDNSVSLRGKIDAGYVYEIDADASFTNLGARLYGPLQQDPPKAMELRLQSHTDAQWDEYSVMRRIPSMHVQPSELSAGSLPRKVARLWVMLKQRTPHVRKLATVFPCPDETQADDWMSLILYPTRIANYLPQPGMGYLMRGIDDWNFVTECRVKHARSTGRGNTGSGFFVTLARRKELSDEIARHANEASYKWRVTDPQVREDVRQAAARNLVEQVFKGPGSVVMTDDSDGKAAYNYVTIRNVESRTLAKARDNRETSMGHVSDSSSTVRLDCPLRQLIGLEDYNRVIELLQSMTEPRQLLAILHKLESDCSWAEAAEAFDIPQGTLRNLIFRFRAEWKLRFGDRETE